MLVYQPWHMLPEFAVDNFPLQVHLVLCDPVKYRIANCQLREIVDVKLSSGSSYLAEAAPRPVSKNEKIAMPVVEYFH